jgi:hypothetical protein
MSFFRRPEFLSGPLVSGTSVYVLSSVDVSRRLMLIAKRDKLQFVVKT